MEEKEKVRLLIRGTQYPVYETVEEAQTEPVVTVQEVWAACRERDGAWYLFYEEQPEGFPEPLKTRIKYKQDLLEINRQGTWGHRMVFESGKAYRTAYPTPYGMLLLDIETHSVACEEHEEDMPAFCIRYALRQEGVLLGEYELHISQ